LPLAARQGRDPPPDRAHRADREAGQRRARHLLHRALVQGEAAAPLPAEEEVLDDVEVLAEREVLVDDLDAEAGGLAGTGDPHRAALEAVLPRVERVDAADALDEGRLSRAVVAHER